MEPVELRSERLVLSIPVAADIDAIVRCCQDPLFERFLTTPWPYTRADAEEFVERIVPKGWSNDVAFTWAVRSPSGALLGMIDWRTRGDVGFWMGSDHRRKGYMLEALTTVCDWVFAERGASRIVWEAKPGNDASARVARAAGFRYAGLAPALVPARDGSHPDGPHGELRRDDDRAPKDGWPL